MTEDRVEQAAQAMAAQMGPEVLQKLAEAALGTVPDVSRLESALHAREAHPDFEYAVTTCGRKQDAVEPDGEGWEVNPAKERDRGDYTETWWWMRPAHHRAEQQAHLEMRVRNAIEALTMLSMSLKEWAVQAEEETNGWDDDNARSEDWRWYSGISNALGGPRLPAMLSPFVVYLLVQAIEQVTDRLDFHPKELDLPHVQSLIELAWKLRHLEDEIRRR